MACKGCAERKKKMLKAWRDLKARAQVAAEKRKK
jgi:hypothetical protein